MLSLRLHLWDLCSTRWIWAEDRWINGNSWLRPVSTPALNARLVHDRSGRAALVIQERSKVHLAADHEPSQVDDVQTVIAGVHASSCEYLTILLEPGGVRLSAGPFGTAPMYLAQRRDLLIASWHLPDVRALIRPDDLLDRAVTRRLSRQARYTADTVLSGVRRLTERATATATHAGLAMTYPDPAEHVLHPRRVRPGVDVVAVFGELLTQVMAATSAASGPAAVELSGGADSANVALTLAQMHDQPVHSYGLVLDGEVGGQQRERRAALVERFGLVDTAVDACDNPPFAPTGVRGRGVPHDPTSAYYREAFDALRDAVQAGSTRIICTGLGGDELCARRPDEYTAGPLAVEIPPWLGPVARTALADIDVNLAPVAPITQPTLMAFGTHNPAYLAAGIWPVSPLAHPELVRFAEQLPLEWRTGKRLLRARLRRAGLAAEVADPSQPETFSDLMQTGLRHYGLPLLEAMLTDSRLVDLGYLDHAALSRAYEQARSADRIPSMLCDAISLEVGLRSLDQAGYSS